MQNHGAAHGLASDHSQDFADEVIGGRDDICIHRPLPPTCTRTGIRCMESFWIRTVRVMLVEDASGTQQPAVTRTRSDRYLQAGGRTNERH